MSWLFFSVATALLWGTAELFYKKGAQPDEKYSHLKISVWVGVVMGAHAIYTLLTQNIGYNPVNILIYLPVSLFYIFSMTFSYFGMRFLEESISDPIENTAGVICVLLFAIFMGDEFSLLTWIAVVTIRQDRTLITGVKRAFSWKGSCSSRSSATYTATNSRDW